MTRSMHIMKAATLLTAMTAGSGLASDAHAKDNKLVVDNGAERVWVYEKTALATPQTSVVRVDEPLPNLIIPMSTHSEISITNQSDHAIVETFDADKIETSERIDVDLIDDSPLFIGTTERTEFDTLEAFREKASTPKTMDVDPLMSVAGAGIETKF